MLLAFISFGSHNHPTKMTINPKLTLISLLSLTTFVFGADHPAPSVDADAALAKLKEGNARFSSSKVSQGKPSAAKRAETAQAQHPFAIVLGCADSRTAPEIVFRSEEHTSELQSQSNLVCRLLLATIITLVEFR